MIDAQLGERRPPKTRTGSKREAKTPKAAKHSAAEEPGPLDGSYTFPRMRDDGWGIHAPDDNAPVKMDTSFVGFTD